MQNTKRVDTLQFLAIDYELINTDAFTAAGKPLIIYDFCISSYV